MAQSGRPEKKDQSPSNPLSLFAYLSTAVKEVSKLFASVTPSDGVKVIASSSVVFPNFSNVLPEPLRLALGEAILQPNQQKQALLLEPLIAEIRLIRNKLKPSEAALIKEADLALQEFISHYLVAAIQSTEGRTFEEAFKFLEERYTVFNSVTFLIQMGLYHVDSREANRFDKVKKCFQNAFKAQPHFPLLHCLLAYCDLKILFGELSAQQTEETKALKRAFLLSFNQFFVLGDWEAAHQYHQWEQYIPSYIQDQWEIRIAFRAFNAVRNLFNKERELGFLAEAEETFHCLMEFVKEKRLRALEKKLERYPDSKLNFSENVKEMRDFQVSLSSGSKEIPMYSEESRTIWGSQQRTSENHPSQAAKLSKIQLLERSLAKSNELLENKKIDERVKVKCREQWVLNAENLASEHYRLLAFDKALYYLDKLFEKNPSFPYIFFRFCFLVTGGETHHLFDNDAIQKAYNQCIQREPEHPWVHFESALWHCRVQLLNGVNTVHLEAALVSFEAYIRYFKNQNDIVTPGGAIAFDLLGAIPSALNLFEVFNEFLLSEMNLDNEPAFILRMFKVVQGLMGLDERFSAFFLKKVELFQACANYCFEEAATVSKENVKDVPPLLELVDLVLMLIKNKSKMDLSKGRLHAVRFKLLTLQNASYEKILESLDVIILVSPKACNYFSRGKFFESHDREDEALLDYKKVLSQPHQADETLFVNTYLRAYEHIIFIFKKKRDEKSSQEWIQKAKKEIKKTFIKKEERKKILEDFQKRIEMKQAALVKQSELKEEPPLLEKKDDAIDPEVSLQTLKRLKRVLRSQTLVESYRWFIKGAPKLVVEKDQWVVQFLLQGPLIKFSALFLERVEGVRIQFREQPDPSFFFFLSKEECTVKSFTECLKRTMVQQWEMVANALMRKNFFLGLALKYSSAWRWLGLSEALQKELLVLFSQEELEKVEKEVATPTAFHLLSLYPAYSLGTIFYLRRLEKLFVGQGATLDIQGSFVLAQVMKKVNPKACLEVHDIDVIAFDPHKMQKEEALMKLGPFVKGRCTEEYRQYEISLEEGLRLDLTLRDREEKNNSDPIPIARHHFRFDGKGNLHLQDEQKELLSACERRQYSVDLPDPRDKQLRCFFARVLKYHLKTKNEPIAFALDPENAKKVLFDAEWIRQFIFARYYTEQGMRASFLEIAELLRQGYFGLSEARLIIEGYVKVVFHHMHLRDKPVPEKIAEVAALVTDFLQAIHGSLLRVLDPKNSLASFWVALKFALKFFDPYMNREWALLEAFPLDQFGGWLVASEVIEKELTARLVLLSDSMKLKKPAQHDSRLFVAPQAAAQEGVSSAPVLSS